MAKIYFYYDRNPLQWMISSRLNVILNYEESFVLKSKAETIREVQSGNVTVQFSAPYFGSEIGRAKEDFLVNDDDIVHITYRPPFFVFSSGTIFVEKGEQRKKKASSYFGSYFKISAFILVFAMSFGLVLSLMNPWLFTGFFNPDLNPGSNDNDSSHESFTVNQQNAIRKAESYLLVMPFSRAALIDQLEYEGFETADAIVGVENAGANWTVQAKLKGAQYLSVMPFSRTNLIQQLEYDGFTKNEAEVGVDSLGANWFNQAELKAAQYLKIMAFSKTSLVQQLEYDGFTKEEAEYGVKSTGLK